MKGSGFGPSKKVASKAASKEIVDDLPIDNTPESNQGCQLIKHQMSGSNPSDLHNCLQCNRRTLIARNGLCYSCITMADCLRCGRFAILHRERYCDHCELVVRRLPYQRNRHQMEKEGAQGIPSQESEQASNTIVTRDEGITVSPGKQPVVIDKFYSAEELHEFTSIMNRWMALPTVKFEANQDVNTLLKAYYLPETLYSLAECAPNLLPFQTFIYSNLYIEVKFVVNAQCFHVGKVVASVKFDSYQADMVQSTVMAALNRNHVILDLASNVQGELKIPFIYHRGFVRNVKHDLSSAGVRPSKYATMYLHVLSPLRRAPETSGDAYITPYFRLCRAKFAAMSYQVKVQMDKVLKFADEIVEVEKGLIQAGRSLNQDKPTTLKALIVTPRPRLNFPHGTGVSDAVPLRVQPDRLTNFEYIHRLDDEPSTVLDLARIWGLRTSFVWSASHPPNKELWSGTIDPCNRSYIRNYSGVPTPLEYVCGMFNFWSGSIEYRFDFVSNKFYSGTVMITIEYGRPVEAVQSACHKASTYSKTFHLGEQRSVVVTVPYIYDTVMRRTTDMVYDPNYDDQENQSDIIKEQASSLRPEVKTMIRVTVMNDLTSTQTVSQDIDVLVFVRAAPNFQVHGLKQQSYTLSREYTNESPAIDSFPRDNYNDIVPEKSNVRRRRSVGESGIGKDRIIIPPGKRNQWNEYKANELPILPLPVHGDIQHQMDTGEKDSIDKTQDFNVGLPSLHLQTSEEQWQIKDILRRPTFMVYRHTVKNYQASNSSFYLPVMPPSREMAFHGKQAGEFSQMIGQTPQASLMDLFRFWRGSSRYTIILHGSYKEPIFVTYLPHSGVRIIGNQTIGVPSPLAINSRPVMLCGLSTEMIIPSINPTLTIEAPYDTENNWTLTFEEDSQRNYSWRDKGDTNAGHIAITTSEDVQLSILWSAGDDFEVSNFYGMPMCKKFTLNKTLSDAQDGPRHQMMDEEPQEDFRPKEDTHVSGIFSDVVSGVKKIVTPKNILRAGVATIPIVGPALAVAPVVTQVEESLNKIDMLVQTTGPIVAKSNEVIAKVNDMCDISTGLLTKFNNLANSCFRVAEGFNSQLWTERFSDLFMDTLVALQSKDYSTLALGLAKFLLKLLNLPQLVVEYATKIKDWFVQTCSGPRTQAPSTQATLAGLLIGMVGAAYNGYNQSDYYWYTPYENFFRTIFSLKTISYLNQVIRFFHAIFDLIKEAILRMLGYVNPEAEALRMLSTEESTIRNFVTSAQTMLSEANTDIMLHPHYRLKFWYTVVQAHQVQRLLASLPVTVVSPPLFKLCTDVVRVGNEKFVDLACSPVRYEPFVICIEGEHGAGKSHLTETLIHKMLTEIGYNRASSGWTYTRSPGSKFWSGLRGQAGIIYDDWMNLNNIEAMTQQISELYQLKSTCTFMPEMAHIEEKRIKANPLIVVLLTNGAFPPNISSVAHHPKAVYRRRDMLLRVRVLPEYKGISPRDLPSEVAECYGHLEFTKYEDPTDKNSLLDTYRSFNDTADYVARSFARYHAQEELNVLKRVEILRNQIGVEASDTIGFDDPFSLLYKTIQFTEDIGPSNNAWIPSERLEKAVLDLIDGIRTLPRENTIVVPPSPGNIFQSDISLNSWLDVPKFIISGAILNVGVASKIAQWTIQGLEKVVSNLFSYSSEMPEGYCVVCMENKPVFVGCSSNVTHYSCESCYTSMRTHGTNSAVSCPLCRDHHMVLAVTQRQGILYTILTWVATNTQSYVVPFIKMLEKSCHLKIHKLYLLVGGLVKIVYALRSQKNIVGDLLQHSTSIIVATQTLNDTREEWYDAVTHHTLGDLFLAGIVRPLNEVVSQIDDWQEYEPPTAQSPRERRIEINIHESVVSEWLSEIIPSRTGSCMHSLMFDNIRDLQYFCHDSVESFRFINQGVMYVVHPNKCCDTCILTTENLLEFVESYKIAHLSHIQHVLQCYFASVNRDPEQALYRIPKCYRPNVVDSVPIVQPGVDISNWWSYMTDLADQYKIPLLVTTGAIGMFAALYKWYNKTPIPIIVQAGLKDYDPSHTRHIANAPKIVYSMRHSQSENTLEDTVCNYIYRNYVTIRLIGEETHRNLTALGIFNHVAIIPKHYIVAIDEHQRAGGKIMVQPSKHFINGTDTQLREYTWSAKDFRLTDTTDMGIFILPSSFELFKDIRKFFCKQADLEVGLNSQAKFLLNPTRKGYALDIYGITLDGYRNSIEVDDVEKHVYYHMLQYNFNKNGGCGSVVLAEKTTRPIVCFHSAGQGQEYFGTGYGVIVTQELLQTLVEQITVFQAEDFQGNDISEAKFIFPPEVDVEYLGCVERSKEPHIPAKSKIEKSLIHRDGGEEVYTEPTILSKTDPRYIHELSPLFLGASKHGKKTKDFPTHILTQVEDVIWNKFFQALTPNIINARKFTPEEAVRGLDGIEGYEPMSLNTSAGYPWTISGSTSKDGWINIIDDKVSLHPELLKELERKEQLRKQGIVPITYFVDTLKDERKLKEKITKAGATRVFCASPQDYTIAMRQNLLHFCAAFMQKRYQLMHAVGINVHGMEWTHLYNKLTHFGLDNIFSLDYSNFGPAFNAKVAKIAANIMIRWTMENVKGVDKAELESLLYECIQSVHICGNTVYRQTCGSPSGAAITTIINSLVNLIYLHVAWLLIVGNIENVWEEFYSNVCIFVYGDDVIMSVSDKYLARFNAQTIHNEFGRWGIVSTMADKEGEIVASMNIKDVSFLKRKWVLHPYRHHTYLAPLDWRSVSDIVQWVWRSPDKREATYVNAEAAVLEAYEHGPQKFQEFKCKVNKHLGKRKIKIVSRTWEEIDHLHFQLENK